MYEILTKNNSEGSMIGQTPSEKLAFWGDIPIPQRSNPLQAAIQAGPMGEIVTFQATLSPSAVAANTTAEQTFTVAGLVATDFVAAVNKPTTQAGLGIGNARISAANTLALTFSNDTTGSITPTASEVYTIIIIRGLTTISSTLTPSPVPANTSMEQTFSIAPSGAAGTASINSAGQVTQIAITAGGSGYYTPPTVILSGGNDPNTYKTGTTSGIGSGTGASSTYPGGCGATGVAIINSSGAVVGVQITNPGSGYTVAPTVTFIGGNNIAPGMLAMVSKPTLNAGVGIGGARVAGNNSVAITFVNNTAAVVTPTSEAYTIFVSNEMPVVNKTHLYGVSATFGGTGASTTSEQSVSLTGLSTTDTILGVSKPTAQTGLIVGTGRVSSANNLSLVFGNISPSMITPTAQETYTLGAWKRTTTDPLLIYTPLLSPASVAANTTAEQTFTVTGLVSGSAVWVNKPSYQVGLSITGCRVSAADTLAITFQNNTAAAIVPTAEVYTVGNFTIPGPGTNNYVAVQSSSTLNAVMDLLTELQQLVAVVGLGKGA